MTNNFALMDDYIYQQDAQTTRTYSKNTCFNNLKDDKVKERSEGVTASIPTHLSNSSNSSSSVYELSTIKNYGQYADDKTFKVRQCAESASKNNLVEKSIKEAHLILGGVKFIH
jgi:hypothetical protein